MRTLYITYLTWINLRGFHRFYNISNENSLIFFKPECPCFFVKHWDPIWNSNLKVRFRVSVFAHAYENCSIIFQTRMSMFLCETLRPIRNSDLGSGSDRVLSPSGLGPVSVSWVTSWVRVRSGSWPIMTPGSCFADLRGAILGAIWGAIRGAILGGHSLYLPCEKVEEVSGIGNHINTLVTGKSGTSHTKSCTNLYYIGEIKLMKKNAIL